MNSHHSPPPVRGRSSYRSKGLGNEPNDRSSHRLSRCDKSYLPTVHSCEDVTTVNELVRMVRHENNSLALRRDMVATNVRYTGVEDLYDEVLDEEPHDVVQV